MKGAVDVTVMMHYNEYKRLINCGVEPDEVVTFNFYDYDMNFPEDGIYCMEDTYTRDPETCRKFVRASIEGWTYALTHVDETIDVIDRYKAQAKAPYNRSHSLWMLNSMNDMIHSSNKTVKAGELLPSDFIRVTNFLDTNKWITNKPLYGEFYKDSR